MLTSYDAKTGEKKYQERLAGGTSAFTASPVAGDGKVYFASEDGQVFVLKAGPTFEIVATNDMATPVLATPAISEGRLFIRTASQLFAIAAAGRSGQPLDSARGEDRFLVQRLEPRALRTRLSFSTAPRIRALISRFCSGGADLPAADAGHVGLQPAAVGAGDVAVGGGHQLAELPRSRGSSAATPLPASS